MIATAGDALLRDVLEHPDEDAVRLIYADWLADQGDMDRAEFVREQIANARQYTATKHVPATGNPELAIVERMPDFLRLPGESIDNFGWNGTGATRIEYDSGAEAEWSRGFVHRVELPLAEFVRDGVAAAIFSAHPVQEVRLTDRVCCPLYVTVYSWVTSRDEPAEDEFEVPEALWNLLTGWIALGCNKCYSSPAEADADLSAACVKYGRRVAGLEAVP